ncbi:MAG: redoxin domain-containing protein [Chitinophaga sp.]|uniref:redoxin domain-containing protein n=1 Tax=Chitinophaga sp. TaxID=1869181 RepID=UPI001B286223|nr:redoxin domain-containing protein [Chitinophaga sp.]MBO9729636.1 redoxin domain-containing protein [Chitinophaga sp.]
MKKITLLALLCWPFLIKAQPASYVLKGKIRKQSGPLRVYLLQAINDKLIVDSTDAHNGVFRITGMVDGPVRAILIFSHTGQYMDLTSLRPGTDSKLFFLEKGDTKIVTQQNASKARITSPTNEQETEYKDALAKIDKSITQINKAFVKASPKEQADQNFIQKLGQRYALAMEARKMMQYKFITEHPTSFLSLTALKELTNAQLEPDQIEPLFQQLTREIRNSAEGKAFQAEITQVRNLDIGQQAPDFEVQDMNGKPVRLSDFKGKTVLLDFWGSWYAPSRRAHEYIREAYRAFKDKNFTVISIALDPPADRPYLEKAIQEDSLVWTNLSDPTKDRNDAAKAFGVKVIPQNYLIDSTGMIINKDLHGPALSQQLSSLLLPENP